LLRRVNDGIRAAAPAAMVVAEESTTFPGVTAGTEQGGLGFHFKWNMGWMNDTLQYMREDPVHRRWHHAKMSFGLVYAFGESYVLPLSHDEVVHWQGARCSARCRATTGSAFANLRAYYGFMWGHPGQEAAFHGAGVCAARRVEPRGRACRGSCWPKRGMPAFAAWSAT
jgi:1,4-alpha-glucan branching enzyme